MMLCNWIEACGLISYIDAGSVGSLSFVVVEVLAEMAVCDVGTTKKDLEGVICCSE